MTYAEFIQAFKNEQDIRLKVTRKRSKKEDYHLDVIDTVEVDGIKVSMLQKNENTNFSFKFNMGQLNLFAKIKLMIIEVLEQKMAFPDDLLVFDVTVKSNNENLHMMVPKVVLYDEDNENSPELTLMFDNINVISYNCEGIDEE